MRPRRRNKSHTERGSRKEATDGKKTEKGKKKGRGTDLNASKEENCEI